MLQIVFHRSKCIGCNACVEEISSRWRISNKDGKCMLIEGKEKKGIYCAKVSMDEFSHNQKAAASCPSKIIHLKVL